MRLRQLETLLTCRRAFYRGLEQEADFFGDVRIVDGETIGTAQRGESRRAGQFLRLFDEERYAPNMKSWVRARGSLPDDPTLHQCILAYASDFAVVVPAIHPHNVGMASPGMFTASLDHAMWFHRPLRIDEWLYCVHESPVSAGARGFGQITFYTREGELVASCAQEGLMRQDPSRPNPLARR